MKEALLIEENKNLIRLKTCDFNTIEEEENSVITKEGFLNESEKEELRKTYEALEKKTECIIL